MRIIKKTKGFTLTEIMIAVSIIAIIISVSIISFNSARENSRNNTRLKNIKEIQLALEEYHKYERKYPENLVFGEALIGPKSGKVFMPQIPINPGPRADGDCLDEEYEYQYDSLTDSYSISFCLSKSVSSLDMGIYEAYPLGIKLAQLGIGEESPTSPLAMGGETYYSEIEGELYRVHTFKNTGNNIFTVESEGEFDVFLVGGGGGAGARGGGGGGYTTTEKDIFLSAGDYTITVGAGGINGNGQPSSAFGFSANGGFGGSNTSGYNGGSGGGAGCGGDGCHLMTPGNGGSDGGAGGGGTGGCSGIGGSGQGTTTKAFGESNGELYGGGGGASSCIASINYSLMSTGGAGGGGDSGQNGEPNTGGGGGGIDSRSGTPGNGGSGIVLIRYKLSQSQQEKMALVTNIFNEYKSRVLASGGEINNENETYTIIENLVNKNLHNNILLHLSSDSGLIKPREVNFAFKENWNSMPYSTRFNMSLNSVSNGIIDVTSLNNDPSITMNSLGSFDPNIYKYIELRYRTVSGTAGQTQIFFLNSRRSSANADQYINSVNMISDNQWRTLRIYMGGHQYWNHSNITGWRYDWSTIASTRMEFDYIGLTDGKEDITAFNLSTNEKNATQTTDYHIPEITNDGIYFNAANQWLISPPITNSNSFTLAMWIKFNSLTPNTSTIGEWIINQRGPNSADSDWQLYRYPTTSEIKNIRFNVRNHNDVGFTNDFGSVNQNPPLNEWIFLTAVVDMEGGELRTYINGSDEVKRTDLTGNVRTQASHMVIGRRGWGTLTSETASTPNATMNDIQIYSKPLTASEVEDLYNSTKGKYGL